MIFKLVFVAIAIIFLFNGAFGDDKNVECFVKFLKTRSLLNGSDSAFVTSSSINQSRCDEVIIKQRRNIHEIALELDQTLAPGQSEKFTKCFHHQVTTDLQENPNVFDFHLLQIVWTANENESLESAVENKLQADKSFLLKINQFSMDCDADNLGCYEKYLKNHSKLISDFRGRYKTSNLTEKQCQAAIDDLLDDFFEHLQDDYKYALNNADCVLERLKIDSRFIHVPMLAKVWRFHSPHGIADAAYASDELEKLGKPLENILNNRVLDEAIDYCMFRNTFDVMQQLYPDVNRLRRCLQKHLLDFPNFLGEFDYALKQLDNGNDEVGLNCTEIVHNEGARIRNEFVGVALGFNAGDKACVEGVFDKQNFSRAIFRVLALEIVEQLSSEKIESEQRLFIEQMADVMTNMAKCRV